MKRWRDVILHVQGQFYWDISEVILLPLFNTLTQGQMGDVAIV